MKLNILSWDQVRKRILSSLATVDNSINVRVSTMESNWQALRYNDAYIEARKNGFGEPEIPDSLTPIQRRGSAEAIIENGKVPDYLR